MAESNSRDVQRLERDPLVEGKDGLMSTPSERKTERTMDNKARMYAYIEMLKNMPDDSPIKRGLRCCCQYGLKPLIVIFMFYVWLIKKIYAVYVMLPNNVLMIIFGAGLCFFGGVYFAAIAAIEAFRHTGGQDMWDHLQVIWDQGTLVGKASLEDDKVDANHNQIADVDEMSCNELISHKAKVAAMAVEDPARLEEALIKMLNVYISVLATLKFEFAKTVMVALGVASMLSLPLGRVFGPFLATLMGSDLNHWVPTIIDTILKIIAVCVAVFVQSFISAFYSGLRGGRMFAEGLINILSEKGIMDKFPDSLADKPFDPDTSYLDECLAYPLAAVGFYVQVTSGFQLVFPFNLLMLPLTIVEWFLRFQIFWT